VFGVVWPAQYLLIGLSAALLHRRGHRLELAGVLGVVAGLNAWWLAFGNTCRPTAAFASIVALLLLAAALTVHVSCRCPVAAALLAPLVLWLAFATYLSWTHIEGAGPTSVHTSAAKPPRRGQAVA
jgi:tryptophan-rich sensory protein